MCLFCGDFYGKVVSAYYRNVKLFSPYRGFFYYILYMGYKMLGERNQLPVQVKDLRSDFPEIGHLQG